MYNVRLNHVYVDLPNFVNCNNVLLHALAMYLLMLHVFLHVCMSSAKNEIKKKNSRKISYIYL